MTLKTGTQVFVLCYEVDAIRLIYAKQIKKAPMKSDE